jgi:ferritin
MAAYFHSENLTGFASWMEIQSQEEMQHAMKIYNYVNERGGRVTLDVISKPTTTWTSPTKAFEYALAHEKKVTASINKLVDLVLDESDHATQIFLQWFVTEQVEEEATADGIIQKLKMVSKAPNGLFLMDRELARRAYAQQG